MMQADDEGSSELDDDDFLGGLSPNDESTPLRISRGKSLLMKPDDKSPSRSPSLSTADSPLSSGGSRKRRRMSQEIQVPQSSVEMVEDTPTATPIQVVKDTPTATPLERDDSPAEDQGLKGLEAQGPDNVADESEGEIEQESENEIDDNEPEDAEVENADADVEATPRSQRFPDIMSQTMLPPASSPACSTQPDDSTPQPIPRKKSKVPTHLSTANLQDKLLPRRRRRPRAGNDLSDESDDQHDAASGDEDELNYPSQSQQSSKRRAGTSKPKPLANARNPRQKKTDKAKSKLSQEPVTYSRSRASAGNKENEIAMSSPSSSPLSSPPESDVSDTESVATETTRCVSDELRAALKKFAEVDQWKMEFEDISGSEI
jgi:hypothetical protein